MIGISPPPPPAVYRVCTLLIPLRQQSPWSDSSQWAWSRSASDWLGFAFERLAVQARKVCGFQIGGLALLGLGLLYFVTTTRSDAEA